MGWIESIIEERGGSVTFGEFMELALYDPDHGYYSGTEPRYGRRGDFLTAPTASPWYARVLAGFLMRLAGRKGPLTFVDLAAGDGSLVRSVSEVLDERLTEVLGRVVAVERSPAMRARLTRGMPAVSEVVDVLNEVARPSGPVVIHASELYDALPVERVVGGEQGLEELWVAVADGGLVWSQRPARDEVAAYFSDHRVRVQPGQIAEACLSSRDLHRHHLEWAGLDALMLTLDYGYDAQRLYDVRGRGQGSLACYRRHQLSRNPLENPGEQDITAHVNWDDLRAAADQVEWLETGLWPLAEFLIRAGLAGIAQSLDLGMEAPLNARTVGERQEIKRLLDPEGMGSDLKILIQGRGPLSECADSIFL